MALDAQSILTFLEFIEERLMAGNNNYRLPDLTLSQSALTNSANRKIPQIEKCISPGAAAAASVVALFMIEFSPTFWSTNSTLNSYCLKQDKDRLGAFQFLSKLGWQTCTRASCSASRGTSPKSLRKNLHALMNLPINKIYFMPPQK